MAGRVAEGIELARETLISSPGDAQIHATLAALLYAAGSAEEGYRATNRALDLAPGSPRPLRVRCEFRTSSGLWPGARDDCARYLEASPDDAGAHFMLGLAQAMSGATADAISSYRRASELDPLDPRPRNNAAELLALRGDLDAALSEAQEAYRLAEKDPNVMDTLGVLYLRKGLAERAVVLLESAHAASPDAPATALHLALAYRDVGRREESRALLAGLEESRVIDDELRREVVEVLHSLR
jgi:Flp pilus assembly protein TadD